MRATHMIDIEDAANVGDRLLFEQRREQERRRAAWRGIRWRRLPGALVRTYVAWVILWEIPRWFDPVPTTAGLIAVLRHVPTPPGF